MTEHALSLYDDLCAIPTVDAHEHLYPEDRRVARKVDIFLLFYQYLAAQLIAAGMDEQDVAALEDEHEPLDRKWDSLSPYLDHVRHNAVARPPFEALKRYFGEEDLTADNYERLTERMRAHNQPGIMEECLREACNIVVVLNQNRTMWQTDLFKPILFETRFIGGPGREGFEAVMVEAADPAKWGMADDGLEGVRAGGPPALPHRLEDFVEVMDGLLEARRSEGMIGVKSIGFVHTRVEQSDAERAYATMRAGTASQDELCALMAYLRDQMWETCGRLGLVGVIHTGVWAGNYADHTTIHPINVQPVALAHRNTRFDLFHAGTPWAADAGMVARATGNVWLNACWSHLISPVLYEQALDMWLDYVPTNRIIVFGGDYWWNVENVYGALMQAREAIAKVLARRIEAGTFDERTALRLAEKWLHDNPRDLYGV